MSPKLRRLSGAQVIRVLESFEFVLVSQKGSHAKIRRVALGQKQTLTIPTHREIDTGTLSAIFRQASRYIPEDELTPHFFSE